MRINKLNRHWYAVVAIEDQIQQLGAKPKNDLPGCFDSILKQINQLEKTLTQALDFVPSYDERQYMEVRLDIQFYAEPTYWSSLNSSSNSKF